MHRSASRDGRARTRASRARSLMPGAIFDARRDVDGVRPHLRDRRRRRCPASGRRRASPRRARGDARGAASSRSSARCRRVARGSCASSSSGHARRRRRVDAVVDRAADDAPARTPARSRRRRSATRRAPARRGCRPPRRPRRSRRDGRIDEHADAVSHGGSAGDELARRGPSVDARAGCPATARSRRRRRRAAPPRATSSLARHAADLDAHAVIGRHPGARDQRRAARRPGSAAVMNRSPIRNAW